MLVCAEYEELARLATWCVRAGRQIEKKRLKRLKRRAVKFNEWLLSSMADNDNFEWTNALTGAVVTGDSYMQAPQQFDDQVRPRVAVGRSTASWRMKR